MKVITEFNLADSILDGHRTVIGDDYQGYRNHVMRMLNFCHYLMPDMSDEDRKKFEIAAAFHDIALWTHDRVDYLEPSIDDCKKYLQANQFERWQSEVSLMIDMHHFISRYSGEYATSVEVFRRADLVDFSCGIVKFGIPKPFIQQVKGAFPNAGFHRTLLRFSWRQMKQHPLNPFPMMRFREP